MSFNNRLALNALRLSDWAAHNPNGARLAGLALALATALLAAAFYPEAAFACPTGGGGTCNG